MLWYSTHSQVIIRAGRAGLQMEIREREEELVALACPDVPVALSIRVVGQRVVRGGKCPRCCCQHPSTALEERIQSNGQMHLYLVFLDFFDFWGITCFICSGSLLIYPLVSRVMGIMKCASVKDRQWLCDFFPKVFNGYTVPGCVNTAFQDILHAI